MGYFYLLIVSGALVLLSLGLHLWRTFARHHRYPFVADPVFFTPAQRRLLVALEQALGPAYRVFGKVRVVDVLGVRPRLGRRRAAQAYARIGERCFDFVVCRADSLAIACAVSLARRSRLRRGAPRDVVDRACAAARLPFVRVREQDDYAIADLEERLLLAMRTARRLAEEQDARRVTRRPGQGVVLRPKRAPSPSSGSSGEPPASGADRWLEKGLDLDDEPVDHEPRFRIGDVSVAADPRDRRREAG